VDYGWWVSDPFRTPVREALPLPAVQVSAGTEHAAVLLEDGTIRAWGWSVPQVRKDGSRASRQEFLPDPPAVDRVVAISCGDSHVLALREDGTVWTWAAPGYGVGPSPTVDRVEGLPAIVQVAAADDNALVLDAEGGIWAWGNNDTGQLGDGSDRDQLLPMRVPDLGPAVTVATGWWTSLAVLADGSVWIWGADPLVMGPVGDGGMAPRLYPREFVAGHFAEQGATPAGFTASTRRVRR
jgi:alpha-tubulin suppressor-like RCC1 family protein